MPSSCPSRPRRPSPAPAPRAPRPAGFVLLDGGPWLHDRRPLQRGQQCGLGGIAAFVVGAIGGNVGLPYALAGALLFSGVLALVAGAFACLAHSLPSTVQVCPRCYSRGERRAPTCHSCGFTPPRRR